MEEERTIFKQEPLSPGQSSRLGHDLMAMQQTYHQGEPLSGGTPGVLDMSQGIRTPTITAGMTYIPDPMTSYALTPADVGSPYTIQDRSLMLGMYGYAPVVNDGKGPYVKVSKGTGVNGFAGPDGTEPVVQTKLRNTSLPGMGKRSHLPKRYKCAMCAYRTRYKSDLNRHVRKHAVATFNCEICNMPFKTIGNVEFHKRKEHSDLLVVSATSNSEKDVVPMKHSCKHCDYVTSYSSDLTRHVRKHFSSKFHCNICNRPFMTYSSLVQHKRTVHDTEHQDIEVIVGDGSLEVVTDGDQSVVMAVEEGDGIFPGKITRQSESPAFSNQTTTGEEDSIPNAHKVTRDENQNIAETVTNDADVTMVTETKGDSTDDVICTKYTCEYCNKSFGRKLVLEYHQKNIHKIMKSGQDSDIFVEYPDDDYDLALDMSIQELENSTSDGNADRSLDSSGKLRHQCQFCAYATNYKSTFDRHVRKHDLECHICDVCRMPFITFGHLQRHIRDNHPDHVQLSHRKESLMTDRPAMYDSGQHTGASPTTNDGQHGSSQHQAEAHGDNLLGDQSLVEMPQAIKLHTCLPNSTTLHISPHHSTPLQIIPPQTMAPRSDQFKAESVPPCHGLMTPTTHTRQSPYSPHATKHKPTSGPSAGQSAEPSPGYTWSSQRQASSVEDRVSVCPPTSGRYAKLVSDYDNFAARPFACALCFFRTGDVHSLVEHAENHLTGCNIIPVPETCMFRMGTAPTFTDQRVRAPSLPMYSVYTSHPSGDNLSGRGTAPPGGNVGERGTAFPSDRSAIYPSERVVGAARIISPAERHVYTSHTQTVMSNVSSNVDNTRDLCHRDNWGQGVYSGTKLTTLSKQQQPTKCEQENSCDAQRKNDRMIPTFSVHYRKDKTNKVRPYLCLLCRTRFRHLMLLKQHFKQAHSESQMGNTRSYTCPMCKEVFTNPMLLQEHHDINH